MNGDDEILAVKAAELYYESDKTQGEIATLLRITRWKVGRLIAQAREQGIVRIEIVHPRARRLPLERSLKETFGLHDAVVVPGLGQVDSEELRGRVAVAAAEYLASLRPVPRTLGISWGRTLHDVAMAAKQGWATDVRVVQINGGVSLSRRASTASSTALMLAQKGGGSATMLPSPAILERVETKRAIEADRTVAGVLDLARNASAYLFSAGKVDSSSVLVESGYISTSELHDLRRKGAVGDVLGRFVDANGYPVDPDLDARTVGIRLEELRSAKSAIAVISGEQKHDICRIVVTGGLCSVLVTDELTAEHLLDESLCP
ncbi:sugar-binding transcriptional regulator [Herbiconiux sp. YIM B11900]|uniref:sugar-binding transcriptional regulator n=1 Tax=Herbiconiux sp. YIM B11900 TaxID=3404131 RepID=UPI003F85F9CF